MITSDPSGAGPAPGEAPQEAPLAETPAGLALPRPYDPPPPEADEATHIHQYFAIRVEETPDARLVTRTEAILEHRHGPDLAGEGERRVGHIPARRPRGRRDGGAPGADSRGTGEFITFGSKSRIPTHMTRAQLEAYLRQERRIALDARDPIAISFAAERYNTILALVQEWPDGGETIDLLKPALSVSQAAKILGYNAKEVRRLLGQGKISGRKVGSEWRIPLRAVL